MSTVDELAQRIAEGDEDAIEELKALTAQLEADKAAAARDLKLKTDAKLRERYPRALRAWDRGKVKFDGGMDDDSLMRLLDEKENEYAEMGVPIEPVVGGKKEEQSTEESNTEEAKVTQESDPAQALAGSGSSSGPGGQARDLVHEYLELTRKGTTEHDKARANAILVELNKTRQMEKVRQITDALSARPITTQGV